MAHHNDLRITITKGGGVAGRIWPGEMLEQLGLADYDADWFRERLRQAAINSLLEHVAATKLQEYRDQLSQGTDTD